MGLLHLFYLLDKTRQPPSPNAWSLVKLPVDGTILEVGWRYIKKLCASKIFIRTGISTLEQIRRSNPRKSELQVAVNIWCHLQVFLYDKKFKRRDENLMWRFQANGRCGDATCGTYETSCNIYIYIIFSGGFRLLLWDQLEGRGSMAASCFGSEGSQRWLWLAVHFELVQRHKPEMVVTSGTLRTGTEA